MPEKHQKRYQNQVAHRSCMNVLSINVQASCCTDTSKEVNAKHTTSSKCQKYRLTLFQREFAENYSTSWQNKIQSVHSKRKHITLLTDVFHTKKSVLFLLETLLSKSSNAKLLHIWSDGPTSQFKNKLIAAAFSQLTESHSVDFQWQALFCNFTWERLCSHTFSNVELRALLIAKWSKKAGTSNR